MSEQDQITITEMMVEHFKQRGTRRLFGVPGGGTSMDLIDAARRAGLDFVLSRREDSGMVMAAVTAWLSGAPGLGIATKGPGVASAANGLASAFLDRAPALFVSDGFGDDEVRYVSHQYFDQGELLGPVTKAVSLLREDDPNVELAGIFDAMDTAPKGPAYIELTASVARRKTDRPTPAAPKPAAGEFSGDPAAAQALLANAKRPVILAGLESAVGTHADSLRRLSETLGAPALVTYMAKGVIPDDHANFAGIFTGGAAEFACVSEADLIIFAGLDPVELIRKPWPYTVPVLDIGAVRHEKHYTAASCGLYGDIGAAVNAVAEGAAASDWTAAEIAAHRARFYDAMTYKDRPGVTPVEIVQKTHAAFGSKPRLAVDAGAHMFSAVAFWQATTPYDVLISNGLATMAFALPAGIAAALQDPERGAVAMTGDGGLMMCLGELVTAAQQRAKLTVIVFNDGALSLIDIKRQEMQMPELGFSWERPDFAEAARGFGCTAWRAETADELDAALAAAAADGGPCLIDVVLNPDGYLEQMRALRG